MQKEKIVRFLTAIGISKEIGFSEEMINKSIDVATGSQQKVGAILGNENIQDEIDFAQDFAKQAMQIVFFQEGGFEKLVDFCSDFLKDKYTEDEFDQLLEFFESDIGQKYVAVSRDFGLAVMAKTNEIMAEHAEMLLKMLEDKAVKEYEQLDLGYLTDDSRLN